MSSAILPHGLERASATLRLTAKDLPTLKGSQCPIGLHLVGSFPPSPPNTATPRIVADFTAPLGVRLSQHVKEPFPRGRVRTSPFAANLTLCGEFVGKSVANCRRSRPACLSNHLYLFNGTWSISIYLWRSARLSCLLSCRWRVSYREPTP